MQINADREKPALVRGGDLPWVQSPQAGVERRMLERVGGEIALATSIVRYRPGSRFSPHMHELGEEFYVLDGTFSDERGDYPAGTYVRNPPGSEHAPFSEHGCIIFVKLRQMQPCDVDDVRSFDAQRKWQRNGEGLESAVLYATSHFKVTLERLASGTTVAPRSAPGVEEMFVVEGSISLLDGGQTQLDRWAWLRKPGLDHPGFTSADGALLWVKRGHLPAERNHNSSMQTE